MLSAIQVYESVRSAAQVPVGALCAANATIYSGLVQVLALAGELEELAGRCGQPGAMHGLSFLLNQEYAVRKVPHLVCFKDAASTLIGSVLLLEYCAAGIKTGMLATADPFGVRTVIGPPALRPQIAAEACSAMLTHGANIVLASFKNPAEDTGHAARAISTPGCLWAVQTRMVQDHLPLAESYDATLARLGKRTRNHLRYYRRRLENTMPCAFYAHAGFFIDASDDSALEELNQRSLKPLAQATFNLQFRTAASLPGGFISGLRNENGRWLSLAGGWRQGNTTWVQWQSNAAGYEEHSLSTVLRSYLIEQEVGLGAKTLAFHGGTSHSMQHAFPAEQVVDLIARRSTPWPAIIARLLPKLYQLSPSLAKRGNFLADTLSNEELRWFPETAWRGVL